MITIHSWLVVQTNRKLRTWSIYSASRHFIFLKFWIYFSYFNNKLFVLFLLQRFLLTSWLSIQYGKRLSMNCFGGPNASALLNFMMIVFCTVAMTVRFNHFSDTSFLWPRVLIEKNLRNPNAIICKYHLNLNFSLCFSTIKPNRPPSLWVHNLFRESTMNTHLLRDISRCTGCFVALIRVGPRFLNIFWP